jgi:hypothetical protein
MEGEMLKKSLSNTAELDVSMIGAHFAQDRLAIFLAAAV